MQELIDVSEAVENPSRRWLGKSLVIVISSPTDMQAVLNSPHCLQKPFIYDFCEEIGYVNNGLFTAKGSSDSNYL